MSKDTVTIQEAADLSKKSVQTIRRAIKAKKLKTRKKKTPQGFNYLVQKASLCELYNLTLDEKKTEAPKAKAKKKVVAEVKQEAPKQQAGNAVTSEDFQKFSLMLEKMMSQHSEERQNFLRLVNTLQEKIFVLENQLSLLRAPEKKWYAFWK